MILSVKDRMVLLSILPAQGNILTLKIIRKLREDLSFSEKEHKKLKFEQLGDTGMSWDGNIDKDIEIGEKAMDIIVNSFKELSDQKKLHMDHLDVYERFIEKEEKS